MSSWTPRKYKTTNWPAYNDELKRRGSLTIWFDPEMTWRASPTGKRGRQPRFSDAAIQICLMMKVLFGLPLQQTTGFVQSLLRLVGLDWVVPDFSTLSRAQRTLAVEKIPYRGSKGPLNLVIPSHRCTSSDCRALDSAGIKAEGKARGKASAVRRSRKQSGGVFSRQTRKHGGSKRRIRRKIHIGIDEETLEVRAVKDTWRNIGDAPILPDPLYQIPAVENIASVTADGTYDTRKCPEAIAARGVGRRSHPATQECQSHRSR